MRTARVLEGRSLSDHREESQCALQTLSNGLEARLMGRNRWYKDNQYLYYEERIVVPEAQLGICSSGPISV